MRGDPGLVEGVAGWARPVEEIPARGGWQGGQGEAGEARGRGRRRGGGGGLEEQRIETTPIADTLRADHHTIPCTGAGEGQATGDGQRRVPMGQVRGELRVERRTSRTFAGNSKVERCIRFDSIRFVSSRFVSFRFDSIRFGGNSIGIINHLYRVSRFYIVDVDVVVVVGSCVFGTQKIRIFFFYLPFTPPPPPLSSRNRYIATLSWLSNVR